VNRRLLPVVVALTAGTVSVAAASGHMPAVATVAPLVVSTIPLPPSLQAVESSAEDIVDFALAGDRASLVVGAATLKAAASGPAATTLAQAGVPSLRVSLLERRANRVGRLAAHGAMIDVALAANAVSELMPGLYGHFRNRVPAAVLLLDYLDREAELRSLARQPDKVDAAIMKLVLAWAPLRPKVIRAGGAKEAASYQQHVAAMKRLAADSGTRLQIEAVRGLNLVDEIERVFAAR
jgi:hypothetical protein